MSKKNQLLVINPATEEVIAKLKADDSKAIKAKYKAAKNAQKAWAKTPIKKRIAAIRKFSSLLTKNTMELAAILTSEMGKPLAQAKGEINGAKGRIDFFLKNSEKTLADEVVYKDESITEKLAYEPLGVIANISAWNYPYLVGVNVFIPALIAGNAVLYKPSEITSLTGQKIAELLWESGIPEDVFQLVLGAKKAGEALLKLPLDGYFFTGSYGTGNYIYQKVAPKMVPCQLELGGKDPMYVTEHNSDITKVAVSGVEGAFYNNGQSCCAVERIYVHEKIYDEYITEFLKEAEKMKVGEGTEQDAFIGPLSRKDQMKVLKRQVKDATKKGANLVLGGTAMKGKGYFFEPTVLINVNHKMEVMKEESFGPIIGIQKVKDDEEAIKLMKDTQYGLTSAVFTEDQKQAEHILSQMNSGTSYWNCCDRVSANLPWSGRGHSGIGSTLSFSGIRAFTQPKGYHLRK